VLAKIKEFFQAEFHHPEGGVMNEEQRRLACAALLIEVAIIDNEFDAEEFQALQSILQNQFDIPAEDCEALTTLAQSECEESTSMYQFTQLVNEQCSQEEKFDLVKGMWSIAYADGDLDKYEEYIIRKVAELIYLSHGDFIRAKHVARAEKQPLE
jgi:uncharacterized tellurite resistance protein B-like protein